MQRRNKLYEREMKCILRELPYFNIRGDISIYHGRFNNSLICNVSNPDQVEYSGNIITDITDHFSQFCIIKSAKSKHVKRIKKMRDFTRFSADALKEDVSSVNWNTLISNKDNDVNKSFSSFFKKLNRIINKHAPVKSVTKRKLKQLHKPWITRGLKTSINKKTNFV